MMTDSDHVKAVRSARIAIREAEENIMNPLWGEYQKTVEEAKKAGLHVAEYSGPHVDKDKTPAISRTIDY